MLYGFNFERITTRTCLWPVVISLCGSFAMSVGLTYRSNNHCFAGTCGETLFPHQARLHVVVWYLWISISIVFLGFRALHPRVRPFVDRLSRKHISIGTKSMSYTSAGLIIWICVLYGIAVGIWWKRLYSYFEDRGQGLPGNNLVAAVAMTGHLADITMGMVLLPVSRHSALASLFKISPVATYTFHMVAGYVLFTWVLLHALLYVPWAITFSANREAFRYILPLFNPTYIYEEVWPGNTTILGYWKASLIFTGLTSTCIMILMFFTSLPYIRRRHFNIFYFTHLLFIIAVVAICLHASTMFYCTLPGILMWLLDWWMRISELSHRLDGQVKDLGNGWFSLSVNLPSKRITGCACDSPLAHFHIHHSGSSIRELHPFTTITDLKSEKLAMQEKTDHVSVEFLIRQSDCDPALMHPDAPVKSGQWTNKLGRLAKDEENSLEGIHPTASINSSREPGTDIKVRLEGPYFKTTNLQAYQTIVCLVAGTGLTGAIAIAKAFRSQNGDCCSSDADIEKQKKARRRCIVIWVVREQSFTELPHWESLQCEGLEIIIHKTGRGLTRPDIGKDIQEICGSSGKDCWAYISGPNGFMQSTEQACKLVKGLTWTLA